MFKSSKRTSGQAGISLVEVMVAALILVTGVLATAGALSTSIIGTRNSQDITKLTAAIRQKMEELRSTDYADLASGSDYLDINGASGSSSAGSAYTRSWTVTADSPIAGLTTITVTATVVQTFAQVTPIQFSLSTYRAP